MGIGLAESLKALQEIDIDLTIVTVDDIRHLIQLVDSLHLISTLSRQKQSRVVFFTEELQELLQEYVQTHKPNLQEPLATVPQMQRPFRRKSPLRGQKLRPKHMRKFFAQEWDRRNGNATIKKLLMGHSIRYDINALHYSHHTVDELQEAYDKIFGNLRFLK